MRTHAIIINDAPFTTSEYLRCVYFFFLTSNVLLLVVQLNSALELGGLVTLSDLNRVLLSRSMDTVYDRTSRPLLIPDV